MPPPTHARRLLVSMLVVGIALTAVLVWPFWVAFFLAAVISATLRSWMEWLARKLRGRRELAAAILTIAVLLAVVLPIALMGTLLVREVLDGIEWVREAFASEGIGGLLRRLPGPLEDAARKLVQAVPQPQQQIQRIAGQQGQQAAGAVATVITATGCVVFQTVMMLIALFFMLVDGARLVGWLDRHVPLRPGLFRELIEEFRKTSVSVLTATLATAGIQTLTALVGYLIARAPNVDLLHPRDVRRRARPSARRRRHGRRRRARPARDRPRPRGRRSSSRGAPPSSRSSTTSRGRSCSRAGWSCTAGWCSSRCSAASRCSAGSASCSVRSS